MYLNAQGAHSFRGEVVLVNPKLACPFFEHIIAQPQTLRQLLCYIHGQFMYCLSIHLYYLSLVRRGIKLGAEGMHSLGGAHVIETQGLVKRIDLAGCHVAAASYYIRVAPLDFHGQV
uniref:Uncharacterized protein MANES_01G158700 n=1 Tax=Rhizophora mucronata TaxID=61149 RepID=A0A2P2JV39_RHIMU